MLGVAGLIAAKELPLAFASCGVCGFGLILFLSTGQSTMQLDSPDASRGRVMALWAMTLSGSLDHALTTLMSNPARSELSEKSRIRLLAQRDR